MRALGRTVLVGVTLSLAVLSVARAASEEPEAEIADKVAACTRSINIADTALGTMGWATTPGVSFTHAAPSRSWPK